MMDLLPDASILHKLGSYCFREVCTFLTTVELLSLWSTNDRRLHALLHRCDAFGLLKLQQDSRSGLTGVLSWMKTLAKPHAKHLDFDLHKLPRSGIFIRRLLHKCTFDSVAVTNYYETGSAVTLKKWSGLVSTDNNASSILSHLHGTTTLTLHSYYSQPTAPIPSTVTDLTMPSQWISDLPHNPNITTLSPLGYCTLKLNTDLSLGPAPILLHGLAATLPNLTKLDVSCNYILEEGKLPIFEVPPNLTHLKLEGDCLPIIIWPRSRLHHLELNFSNPTLDPTFAPLVRLARCVNFYSLKHFLPDLVYLKLFTTLSNTGTDAIATWASMVAHIGKPMSDRLLPPGYTSERLLLTKEMSLYHTPFAASVVYTLPPLVTSLDLLIDSIADFRELLTALNHSTTSKSVSSLHVTLYTHEVQEFNDPIRLPSNITKLKIEPFPLTCEFVRAILPTSLTRLEATFDNVEAIIAVRKQIGPSIEIIGSVGSTVAVSALHLSQFYTTSTTTQHTSTRDTSSTSESISDSFTLKPSLPPTSLRDASNPARRGPYGAWDVCDANGNWTVTIPGIKNALAQLVGHRTTCTFSISAGAEWPPSVTRLDETGHDGDNIYHLHLGVAIVGFQYAISKSALSSVSAIPKQPPHSIARLSSLMRNNLNPQSFASLPLLTELNLPRASLNWDDTVLPIGLRTLSICIHPPMYDFKLRDILKRLPFLERAEFDATGIIFTAPNWPFSSLTLVDLESWLESYLRPNGNTKITLRSMERISVSVQLLPPTLTSLDLLRSPSRALDPILPSGLTRYLDYLDAKAPPLLETLPNLTDVSLHIPQYHSYDLALNLPSCLQSLCITTSASILDHYHSGDEGSFNLSVNILPCVGHLHTLAVPSIKLKSFTANLIQLSNDCVLPNLTRLIISASRCSDTDIYEVLQSNFFKLRRLTLAGYVRFTGQLVTESSTSPVSFKSLFRDTRTALLRVLESHERKSMNKQRSNDPSQLERHEKSSQLSHPISAATTSSIEPASLPSTVTDVMSLEVNMLMFVTSTHADSATTKIVIPSDSTHVSLLYSVLTRRPPSAQTQINVDPSTLGTTPTDWLENEVRKAMTDPCVEGSFAWSSISNWMDLNRLVDIEYESDEVYEPGDYFQYPSLQRLKIRAPIAEIDDANALKYSVWKVPSSLTHLVVTRAMRSFTFICADDSKDLQLSTLELPQAIWQSEDCVPPSLRKLLVMDCNPRSLSRDLESRGCEIVFN